MNNAENEIRNSATLNGFLLGVVVTSLFWWLVL